MRAYGFQRLHAHLFARRGENACARRAGIVVARGGKVGERFGGVIGFAHEDVAVDNRAVAAFPAFVRVKPFFAAVAIADAQRGAQQRGPGEIRHAAGELVAHIVRGTPTGGHLDADAIFALPQCKAGIHRVVAALFVFAQRGVHKAVVDLRAVERDALIGDAAGEQTGVLHRAAAEERLGKAGHGVLARLRLANPRGLPFAQRAEAEAHARRGANRAAFVHRFQRKLVDVARRERLARVGGALAGAAHPLRIPQHFAPAAHTDAPGGLAFARNGPRNHRGRSFNNGNGSRAGSPILEPDGMRLNHIILQNNFRRFPPRGGPLHRPCGGSCFLCFLHNHTILRLVVNGLREILPRRSALCAWGTSKKRRGRWEKRTVKSANSHRPLRAKRKGI